MGFWWSGRPLAGSGRESQIASLTQAAVDLAVPHRASDDQRALHDPVQTKVSTLRNAPGRMAKAE